MRAFSVAIALSLAMPAVASHLANLPPAERAAFEAELHAAILANGDVIANALAGPQPVRSEMQQYIEDDLTLLNSLAPVVLDGKDIALFTSSNCADCKRAEAELSALANTYGIKFILHDLSTPAAAAWADQLGLDEVPFYVLPRMILRGHMPRMVLQKYLSGP